MARTGRPTILTEALSSEIVGYIEAGNYLETAAALAGVNPSTVRRWLRKGRRAKSGLHYDFCTAVRKAEGHAEQESINRIRAAAGRGVWVADAWYLERKFPQRWGRWDRVTNDPRPQPKAVRKAIETKSVRDALDEAARQLELASDASGDGGKAQ